MSILSKLISILTLATLLSGWVTAATAQITDRSGTQSGLRGAVHSYKYDARTTALGDANVGGIHGLMNLNMNPAALPFVQDLRSVQVNVFQNWNNNTMMENVAFPLFANQKHTLAGQLARHHSGFSQTNLLGTAPNPQPSLTMYQADLAYAYTIQNVLSLGVLNNYSYATNPLNNAQYWTSFVTLGATYSPSEAISYGAVFRGLGRSVTYEFIGDGETVLGSQNLREVLEIGATMRFPVRAERTKMTLSLANEKRFGQNGIWYKGGLEVNVQPFLSLRGGLLIQSATNVRAPRLGIGYISDVFEVDYALSFERRLYERYHQLSLTLHIGQL